MEWYLKVVRDNFHNWRIVGIEPSIWASEYGRNQYYLDIINGDLNQSLPKLNSNYNLIVAWDVLEHLQDPLLFLRQIKTLMSEQTYFCFSTLDIDTWFPKLMGSKWPWFMDMHLFYFENNTLKNMLRSEGLEIINTQNYVHYASLQYLGGKIKKILPKFITIPFSKLLSILPSSLVLPFSFGDIKLYVCKKI